MALSDPSSCDAHGCRGTATEVHYCGDGLPLFVCPSHYRSLERQASAPLAKTELFRLLPDSSDGCPSCDDES